MIRHKMSFERSKRISRNGHFGMEESDASPVWESCPNRETHFVALQSAWNYQERFIVNGSKGGLSTDQWLSCSSV